VAQHALSSYKGGRDDKKNRQEFYTKADKEKAPRDKQPKMDKTRLERLIKKVDKRDPGNVSPILFVSLCNMSPTAGARAHFSKTSWQYLGQRNPVTHSLLSRAQGQETKPLQLYWYQETQWPRLQFRVCKTYQPEHRAGSCSRSCEATYWRE